MIPFRTLCSKLRAAIKGLTPEERASLGVLPKCVIGGSSYSYRVDPSVFLNVCARLGIDPMTGEATSLNARPGTLALWHIAAGCSITRDLRKLSMRAAALECGVSAATLTRLENGLPVSIESVLAVCEFIGVHPFESLVAKREVSVEIRRAA